MYPAATTWKANSGGTCGSDESDDNTGTGSDGSTMPGILGIDELLFKSRIMFNNIRSLKRSLIGMGMLYKL